MRLFIGIALPDSYQQRLKPLTDELASRLQSKVRWTRPGNWHLTLKFLGEVDDSRVDDIIAALNELEFPAFDIRPGGYDCFPNIKWPRVIWMAIRKGAHPCGALAGAIDSAMAELGFKPESKSFKSHLTLGRVKKHGRDDWASCLRPASQTVFPGIRVDRFVLWRSELRPDGAVHTPLKEFPLGTKSS